MTSELEQKIEKYKKAKLASSSEVERSQYEQLIRELEAQRPKPKLHIAEEAVCESCQ